MNADARMTRRFCDHPRGRILPHGMLLCELCQCELAEWRGPHAKATIGLENRFSVDFTDRHSSDLTPAERDELSIATGDDWA